MDRSRVVIAEILRPRGNRGELLALSQTDVEGRLESLKQARARLSDGSDVDVEVERVWFHDGKPILKFAGVDTIDAAGRFRGADLWVPAEERGQLPEGEWFQTDLIGCAVIDGKTGHSLGTVESWEQYSGAPLLGVQVSGREVLIPFVPSICREVDLEKRVITVELPEGLLEL